MNAESYALYHWFPTGMPRHPIGCHLQYSGVPRANVFLNISLKILFSKCYQTVKQIATGSPPGAANYIFLL